MRRLLYWASEYNSEGSEGNSPLQEGVLTIGHSGWRRGSGLELTAQRRKENPSEKLEDTSWKRGQVTGTASSHSVCRANPDFWGFRWQARTPGKAHHPSPAHGPTPSFQNPKGITFLMSSFGCVTGFLRTFRLDSVVFCPGQKDDGMKGLQIPLCCALVKEDTGTPGINSPAGTLGICLPTPTPQKKPILPLGGDTIVSTHIIWGTPWGGGLYWSMYISATFSKQFIHKGRSKIILTT